MKLVVALAALVLAAAAALPAAAAEYRVVARVASLDSRARLAALDHQPFPGMRMPMRMSAFLADEHDVRTAAVGSYVSLQCETRICPWSCRDVKRASRPAAPKRREIVVPAPNPMGWLTVVP